MAYYNVNQPKKIWEYELIDFVHELMISSFTLTN